MNQVCIKLRISILVLFFPFFVFSQRVSFDTVRFYQHLIRENLLPEQISFARQLQKLYPTNKKLQDSLFLNISLAYNRLSNPDSLDSSLCKISTTPAFSVSSSNLFLCLLILRKNYDRANSFLNNGYRPQMFYQEAKTSVKILQNASTRQDTSTSQYSSEIQDIKHRYDQSPKHSAFLAGFYSALIPGMGKLYLGYKQEAISACIENIALGGVAAESYFKAGPLSARFVITGALFALFYGGNIWGSAILAKKQKVDYKKQLDYEIFNYYSSRISNSAN
jgi:hypothetical protein